MACKRTRKCVMFDCHYFVEKQNLRWKMTCQLVKLSQVCTCIGLGGLRTDFSFFLLSPSRGDMKTYFWQVQGALTFPLCSQIPLDNMTNEMEQRVEPHNDYFSTQFLLNFVILGTHNITVESSVIDSNGIVWKTGPKTTIFVKSLEDPYSQQVRLQQQQGQAPAQQQQQRSAYSRF